MAKTKRTYQPSKTRRANRFGFRARKATKGGRNVIKNRRNKGRKNLANAAAEFGSRFSKNKRLSRRR